ncbi:MAG: amidohydrolase family protein [Gemmatimonadales bacterium]|nr:amidohydrolase family protein [Gemmatimonadales bacterium]
MSTRFISTGLAAALAGLAPGAVTAQGNGQSYAITNATIVPVVGARIDRGTVVIQGGKITAVGASVAVPAGAQRVDGTGLFVYPGLIDAGTRLGLTEIGSVPGSEDTQEIGPFNPHNEALTAVNPSSELIPVTRVSGLTTAITSATGGSIQGWAALIDLAGWTPDEMALKRKAAMVMTYPRVAGGRGRGGFRGQQPQGDPTEAMNRQVKELTDYLRDARAYNELAVKPKTNLAFQALAPIFKGEAPVIFDVQTAGQIRGAIALADTFKLKIIIRGGSEAWQVAELLAQRKIPVIVGPTTETPGNDEPYDAIYANPGALAKAGVTIAFQTADAAESRNLPYNAALATAYGLDPDEALRALTINPARMFGVDDRIGSIEVGKDATLQVTTGDPLDARTVVKHVFIRGQSIPMNDRHNRLYETYRARPKP